MSQAPRRRAVNPKEDCEQIPLYPVSSRSQNTSLPQTNVDYSRSSYDALALKKDSEEARKPYWKKKETLWSWTTGGLLVALAAIVRFWGIGFPDGVVFDEVHFGKFASYYILREYYFDVHPPLSKMLLGLAGYLSGFDGLFDFENIGDKYVDPAAGLNVPFKGMRSMPAVFGSLTVGVVYWIMRESGYPVAISAFSAGLILFDNLHVVETRLILLDGALILFMSLSLLSYIKFHQLRYRPFSTAWWAWLSSTGFFLACTLGCKMVGLLTFCTIGTAVVWDLWGLLDIKRSHPLTMEHFSKHFLARTICLIVVPFGVYLSFFWLHFKILNRTGTGDTFMSAAFQETLMGNELLMNSQELRYLDTITIRHKETNMFLHSHVDRYPLRYDDGRISSQGQQVTGYPFNDTNNNWQIIPTHDIPDSGRGRICRHKDIIQLYHPMTDSYLLTHDVASPLTTTNQEFTTWPKADINSRYNDTLFEVVLVEGFEGEPWKTKSGWFQLVHVPTSVKMWTGLGTLPDWGYKQQEINGNKAHQERSSTWFADEIISDESLVANRTGEKEVKKVVPMNFFKKFFELQVLMLQHNAGLTADHPYASQPIDWPFDLSGISFWTDNVDNQQVYAIGNLLGWWICVLGLSVFVGIVGADALARRRGIQPIEDHLRNRLYNNTGFFLVSWMFHYFPFYMMSRQLFIHHYLPAHLSSALVAGSILNFILTETINYPVSVAGTTTRLRPRLRAVITKRAAVVLGILSLAVVGMFGFLSPFTYGSTGLTPTQSGYEQKTSFNLDPSL
ncbi:glycosyltransferase family 39 protein [Phaffia rhodozyma]|uniref:Dolichyl-phosphate-mannose--protein mannosyltransferase n=1 Tax=Phaffia rhodozyma TaxID=264483 RepID=A0A0F7SGQ9_PHARH|nr:glycosyltransferase family 39 protein [Phaffia rhodozyma]